MKIGLLVLLAIVIAFALHYWIVSCEQKRKQKETERLMRIANWSEGDCPVCGSKDTKKNIFEGGFAVEDDLVYRMHCNSCGHEGETQLYWEESVPSEPEKAR